MTHRVTIVCGPPCAGKTTWVAQHAEPDDTVLDVDVLAKLCGSDRDHGHEGRYYRDAQTEFWALCESVRASTVTAWVIRGAPEPEARRKLAEACGATRTIVLLPPLDVLHARALERDVNASGAAVDTIRAITKWHRRYKPARGDVLIRLEPTGAR
jgi:5-methylcytosine-specific restriction protein A